MGSTSAIIRCISFSKSSKWIAITSDDKPTIHIFSLKQENNNNYNNTPTNPTSSLSKLSFASNYFKSERSFAQL